MRFWDWALAVYDRPGVSEICLSLQDDHGQQTAFLLWAAFSTPSDGDLSRGAELARHWDLEILGPIRQSRRSLKPPVPPVDDQARLALREEVKRTELFAERVLMETLEALASRHLRGSAPFSALLRAGDAWGDPPPRYVLQSLAERLV